MADCYAKARSWRALCNQTEGLRLDPGRQEVSQSGQVSKSLMELKNTGPRQAALQDQNL